MSHWARTEFVKNAAKKLRRRSDREEVSRQEQEH